MNKITLPAEWYPQSAIQITWPHDETDWSDMIDEVEECYIAFSKEILMRQKLIVCATNPEDVKIKLSHTNLENLIVLPIDSNDTWARDHGAISIFIDNKPAICDFGFNAWGLKFPANLDNQIPSKMFKNEVFRNEVRYIDRRDFVLEGGSIESDGEGTLLTTTHCLMAENRNQPMDKQDVEDYLKSSLGFKRILWLNHGYLEGDDTDSHVDTLARFADSKTIVYVKCDDTNDVHYKELKKMEQELQEMKQIDDTPYKLISVPMAKEVRYNGERLPLTYANFLIINKAVLLPVYGQSTDDEAYAQISKAFPDRDIVKINCSALVKQHGSLHCVTMQFPEEFI